MACLPQVYHAQHPGRHLRVYSLRYASSLESDKYAAALSREQRAFEDLIAQKRHMVLPDLAIDVAALSQHPAALGGGDRGPLLLTHPGVDPQGSATNALTRRAGGLQWLVAFAVGCQGCSPMQWTWMQTRLHFGDGRTS